MNLSMARVLDTIEPRVRIDLTARTVTVGAATSQHRERRDLVRDLGTFIYTHFHVGHHIERIDPGNHRDWEYEAGLCRRYADRPMTRRVPVIDVQQDDLVVSYLGVRVRVPRSSVTLSDGQADLAVPLLSPALSPGFVLARGPEDLAAADPTLRVYVGAHDRDRATEVFHRVLDVLRVRRRWQAKVTSQDNLYPRSDAVTVYLHPSETSAVGDLAEATRDVRSATEPVSQFVLPLGPGLGCAWDPDRPGVSFGQHRARVVGQVLMARAEGSWDPATLDETCRSRGIDPDNIWRNPASPDLDLPHRPVQEALATAAGKPQ